jgi:hypothetical protein
MYRVSYYINGSSAVAFKEFDNFEEAMTFSLAQPKESILEIKQYDNKISNIQNESNSNS